MHVCYLVRDFIPHIGGTESLVYTLAKGFVDNGHKVTVICNADICQSVQTKEGMTIHHIPMKKRPLKEISRKINKIVAKTDADVLHAHTMDLGICALGIAEKQKLSLFLSFHNPIRLKEMWELVLTLPFRKIIVPSKFIKKEFSKIDTKNKVKVIYNGVNRKLFNPTANGKKVRHMLGVSNEDILLFCPARLVKQKGMIYLIKALSKLDKRYKLLLSGPKERSAISADLNKTISKLKLKKQIIFKTFKNYRDMPQAYGASDVVVLPSVWNEPFGMVLIEGMACGKPVIASNVGGIPEIIQTNWNGLLFKPKNAREIWDSIIKLESASLRNKLIRNGLNTIKNKFSEKMLFDRHYSLYSTGR